MSRSNKHRHQNGVQRSVFIGIGGAGGSWRFFELGGNIALNGVMLMCMWQSDVAARLGYRSWQCNVAGVCRV